MLETELSRHAKTGNGPCFVYFISRIARLPGSLGGEELVHLRLRRVRGTKIGPFLLNLEAVLFERPLVHAVGSGVDASTRSRHFTSRDRERGHIRLPRFRMIGAAAGRVRHRRRVILVCPARRSDVRTRERRRTRRTRCGHRLGDSSFFFFLFVQHMLLISVPLP